MIDLKALIHPQWLEHLQYNDFDDNLVKLETFLAAEKAASHRVFPDNNRIFSALNYTLFDEVKVVIIGQDPYHGAGQANGLSFSVNDYIKKPPSLVNIFKELKTDLGLEIPKSGNLESWSKQGVLLLNATLTVREGKPGSHQKKGWETITDKIIQLISEKKKNVVFLLWGNFAKSKITLIDESKHHILSRAHPSPLARGAFFGCAHFSQTNKLLKAAGLEEINWRVEENNDKRLSLFDQAE